MHHVSPAAGRFAQRVAAAVVPVGLLVGAVVRVWLLLGGRGALTGDEAVVGLMSRQLLSHGNFDAFFWGQHYGGTLEAVLCAPFVALFGTTAVALRIVPTLVFSGACVLAFVIARRAMHRSAARCVAVLMWVWPANLLWHSSREWGFYGTTLLLGLALVELALRIVETPTSWRRWSAFAAIAGLAWWTSPQSLHFLIPAIAWVAFEIRGQVWRLVAVLPIAAVTAAPWLAHNLRTGWASFDTPSNPVAHGYVSNLGVAMERALPVTFGLSINERWTVPAGPVVYWCLVAVVVVTLWRHRRALGLVALVLSAFPFIYAMFPLAAAVGEGRYTVFALPFLAMALIAATPRAAVRAGTVVVATTLTLSSAATVGESGSPLSPDAKEPVAVGPLIDALDRAGVEHVWTAYHTAYRIDYHSDERIVAAPNIAGRWLPYQHAVAAAPRPAWVFPLDSQQGATFRRGLDALHDPYDTITASGYVAYWPHDRVAAATVLAAGRNSVLRGAHGLRASGRALRRGSCEVVLPGRRGRR